MAKKPSSYLKLFTRFLEQLRIDSKHKTPEPGETGVKLELWESQQRVLNEIGQGLDEDVHVFYILKSRQLGVSTVTLAILLFWALIHPRINLALVLDDEKNSAKFRDTLRNYFNSFPADYFGERMKITADNAKIMSFSNGSNIDFLYAGKSKTTWGDSRAYAAALLSEVALYGKAEGINSFIETFSQSNPIRLYIFESRAKGRNHWYEMWKDAAKNPHTMRRIFIGWWASQENRIDRKNPRFKQFGLAAPSPKEQEKIDAVWAQYQYKITQEQLAWYREYESSDARTREMMDEQQPWVEDDSFVTDGMSFFQTRKISDDMERALDINRTQGAQWFRYYLGEDFLSSTREQILDPNLYAEVQLRIWEQPDINKGRYVIGVDPAYGRNENADNFVISVWRCFADRLVQVAEYASHDHQPQQATWVLADLAGRYKNCMINLEINGPGNQVMMELNSLRNMLRAQSYNADRGAVGIDESMLDSARWYLYRRPDSMGAGFVYNFSTGYQTKGPLIHSFSDSHRNNLLLIQSLAMLNEMYEVRQKGRDIEASPPNHDDRVFAAALANRAWCDWVRPGMIQNNMTYAREMGLEDSLKGKISDILNAAIGQALARQDQPPPENKFFSERGLSEP